MMGVCFYSLLVVVVSFVCLFVCYHSVSLD